MVFAYVGYCLAFLRRRRNVNCNNAVVGVSRDVAVCIQALVKPSPHLLVVSFKELKRLKFLRSKSASILEETCWSFSNIP